MIVVDSSAFIEYYRPGGDEHVSAAVAEAIASDQVMISGIIQVEIVAFASARDDYKRLSADFQAFHWLETSLPDYERAAEIGFQLRRDGLTVPAADLIIAASVIRAGATLYHIDQHYVGIAERTDLQARHLLQ